jgi:peptidoglycan/LPS O-acetylase OafA/YrhL
MNAGSSRLEHPSREPTDDAVRAPARSRQIYSHTGLRGVAALLVVAYHQQIGPGYKLPFEVATALFRRCYLMVDLFFVLSGFIISYVYIADRQTSLPRSETKSFLLTRFARIYPLHLFSLAYLTVFTIASMLILSISGRSYVPLEPAALVDWLVQLLLLNAWLPHNWEWNIPSWSISAEAFAYLIFPLIVAAHVHQRRPTQLVLLAASIAFYSYVAATSASLDIVVGLAPLRCIAGFALGMFLYFHRSLVRSASDRLLSLLQLLAASCAALALAFSVSDPLVIPAFALLVFATWTDRGVVASVLSTRIPQWLGEVSYSVYLLHVPIGATIWFVWGRLEPRLGLDPGISRGLWLCIVFTAVLTASHITYKHIELPARRSLLRWWGHRRPPSGDVVIAAP